jgi:type II secretory pathway component PulF
LAEDPRLPRSFSELFAYGETANTLPAVIEALASAFEARAERQSQALMQLFVPVLTLIIGGAIAGLVYAVMGAVLSVNDLGTL